MMKILTGLFALILVAGLLVACQNPSAAPSTPDPDPDTTTTPVEPDPDPEPVVPAITDLLGLEGWDRSDDDGFTWTIKAATGSNKALETFVFRFTDAGDDVSVGTAYDAGTLTAITSCGAPLDGSSTVVTPEVDGTTITISFEFGASPTACSADNRFAGWDRDGDADTAAADPIGTTEDDMVVFTLVLANLPNIKPVEKAKDQKISVTGMVTLTGGGDEDVEAMFGISDSTVTYNTPNIKIDQAN